MMIQNITRTRKAYRNYMEPLAQKYMLVMAEVTILQILDQTDGELLASDICDLFGMAKSNVSKAVAHLCLKGWLMRRKDVSDRKKLWLSLTDKALPAVTEIREASREFAELCTAGFTEEEKKRMNEMLERISRNIEEVL